MISMGGLSGSGSVSFFSAPIHASIPSLCGMLVYRDETSMLTRMLSFGTCVVVINLINSIESFMYDGSFCTSGFSHPSTKLEIFSVTEFTLDTIGLIPIGFLWIFLRKYNLEVL